MMPGKVTLGIAGSRIRHVFCKQCGTIIYSGGSPRTGPPVKQHTAESVGEIRRFFIIYKRVRASPAQGDEAKLQAQQ